MALSGASPSPKRIKLDDSLERREIEDVTEVLGADESPSEADSEHCSICLQRFVDRSVIPNCAHEFCFECIMMWTEQSRRCPLCSQTIGSYLIHHIRSKYDYQKHHLTPLRSSPPPLPPLQSRRRQSETRRVVRERRWGRRERQEREEADAFERAIDKRRWIYQHHLYAKHVASNPFTRYRPFPTPSQFTASQDLIGRATSFIRRELCVWVNLDNEFLTTFILSLMRSIDIRSESAVKLLAEFLDMDTPYVEGGRYTNAEQFAHELYSYLRSPYRDLATYDAAVQYDVPSDVTGPSKREHSTRWYTSADRDSRSGSPVGHQRSRDHSHTEALEPTVIPSGMRHLSHKDGRAWSPIDVARESRLPSTTGASKASAEGQSVASASLAEHSRPVDRSHRRSPLAEAGSQRDRKGKQREVYQPDIPDVTHSRVTRAVTPVEAPAPGKHGQTYDATELVDKVQPIQTQCEIVPRDPPVNGVEEVQNTSTDESSRQANLCPPQSKIRRNPLASAQAYLLKANNERVPTRGPASHDVSLEADPAQPSSNHVPEALIDLRPLLNVNDSFRSENGVPFRAARPHPAPSPEQAVRTAEPNPSRSAPDATARMTKQTRTTDKRTAGLSSASSSDASATVADVRRGSGENGTEASRRVPDLRALLVKKLQEEKARQATHDVSQSPCPGDLPAQPDSGGNLATVEARLRTKAYLRIKLAAEKQAAAVHSQRQAETETDGEAFVGKGAQAEAGMEELLRAKLRQRLA